MDVELAIITALWNLIKGDPQLQGIMAHHPPHQEWLHLNWAETDAPFPYMVHRLELNVQQPWPIAEATYFLDLWDDSPNAGRLYVMRGRLVTLLDRCRIEVPGQEIMAARVFLQAGGSVPEPEPGIQHYTTRWAIRFARAAEVEAITEREA